MPVVVKNVGTMQTNFGGATTGVWYSGGRDTNRNFVYGDTGTVRVVYLGVEYVFGPNQSKSFSSNVIGTAVAAADSRLSVIAKS